MTIQPEAGLTSRPLATRSRPRILFIVDIPNWAHDFKTENIRRVLADDYEIIKKYQDEVKPADLDQADLIAVYYWLQIDRMKHLAHSLEQNKQKLLMGICSNWEVAGPLRKPALATLRKWARGVFVNNLSLFDEFESAFDVPVFYTPNGVDREFYSPRPREKPAELLRVGWAGSVKNHGPGQRGFNELIAPAVNNLAGAELVSAVREDRWRTPQEMREFYRSLDVYVCASKSEGTPNPCLEAAACGIPLVTTAVGNMPELVRHGRNGFLIQPNTEDLKRKLRDLRDSPDLRTVMSRHLTEDICRWDWKVRAGAYRGMFDDALSCEWQRTPAPNPVPTDVAPCHRTDRLGRVRSRLLTAARENLSSLPGQFFARRRDNELTVVILSHGRLELTLNAIRALREHVSIPFNLLVIDNGSDAGVQAELSQLCGGLQHARLISLPENRGCAGGRILGLSQAQTEYVMFVDNDVEILPGALEHLLNTLETNPRLVAAMAKVVFPDGFVQLAGGDYRVQGGVLFYKLHGAGKPFTAGRRSGVTDCKWVSGTATMFRREALTRHSLDGSMRAYYEDFEWCYRVNQSEPGRFCANSNALALHYYRSKLPARFASETERRTQSIPYLETIAYFYQAHGLIIHSLFSFVPELGHPSHRKSIRSAQAFLDLVNLKGAACVVEQWNARELDSLFQQTTLPVRFIKTSRAAVRIFREVAVGRLG